jgi:hypothetical protein
MYNTPRPRPKISFRKAARWEDMLSRIQDVSNHCLTLKSVSTAPSFLNEICPHTIQVIRCDQQLQAKFRWDIHIGDVFTLSVLLVVVEILADFF